MDLRKTILLAVTSLLFLSTASTANIQVEGLTEEDVNATFVNDTHVRFTTSYLDKTLTPRQVFVPNTTDHALVDWSYTRESWGGSSGISTLNYQYGLAYNYDYPSPEASALLGQNSSVGGLPANYFQYSDSFYSNESSRRGTVFESGFADDKARWNITVRSHYEHLIVEYELIHGGEVQDSFQDVYSGEDTERLPASGNLLKYERNGEYQDRISLEYDRLYESGEKEVTVAVLHENSREFREFQSSTGSFEEIDSSGVYSRVEDQAQQVGATEVLVNDISNYDVKAFNVTVPGNTSSRFEAFVESPETVQQDMSMYVLGSFAGGSGTSSDPYEIDTCQQLQNVNENLSASFELISDVDCSSFSFNSLGDFRGVFNGGGYEIKDLTINEGSSYYVGLIGENNGVVKNVGLINVDISGGNLYVGGLVGVNYDTVSNSYVTGSVSGSESVGGLIGQTRSASNPIDNSYAVVDVSGTNKVGGLVGSNYVELSNVYSGGSVSGDDKVGGLVGYSESKISHTYSTGNVSGGTETGGLLGSNCYNNFGSTTCSTLEYNYWDVNSSGQSSGIGDDSGGVTGLNTTEMKGDSASTNFAGFNFSSSWEGVKSSDSDTSADGYPILRSLSRTEQLEAQGVAKPNTAPEIDNQEILWKETGGSETKKINYSLSDPDGDDISSHNTIPKGTEEKFTNSTLKVSGISSPFDYLTQIADFAGATASIETNYTFSDTGYQEDDYSHDLTTQQVSLSSTVENRGASSDYEISHANPSGYDSVVQGTSWSGTLSSGQSITKTSVWSGDWITGETESTYSKYPDSDYNHGEDTQRIHNRTELVVDNEKNIKFHDVGLTSKCSRDSSADVPVGTGVRISNDCTRPVFKIDAVNQSTSTLYEDTGYSHSLSSQGVAKNKTLNETEGYSFTEVNVSAPSLPGSVVNGGMREVNLSSGEVETEIYNSTGDWIQDEREVQEAFGQDLSQVNDIDQQSLYNQTRLVVNNTRSFGYSSVDLSNTCSDSTEADIPSGKSTATDSCNNGSISGDWIKNEENQSTEYVSGDVLFGKDLSTKYTAAQGVEVTNVRADEDLEIDLGKLVSDVPGCSLANSSTQNVPADSVSQFEFRKSCSPGQHLNRTPVVKTETDSFYKYDIEFGFKVHSNLTEEQGTEYAVKSSWADNWNSRDPTETEALVDNSSKDIQVNERIIDGTEYIIFQIGDEHTNSSIHDGTHSASLTYYEDKTPGSTSGGSSSGGGFTGGGSETTVDENNGSKFAWSVSAITSDDTQQFGIQGYSGDSFEKYIVVTNTGGRNVTLDLDCVSQTGACRYVDTSVDRVVLNRNSFSEKEVKVSGQLPGNFSQRTRPATFSIRVTDPEWNGSSSTGDSVSYVDFTVSNSPVFGKALDLAYKVVEIRSLESPFDWGNDVPYPFIIIPMFLSMLMWGAVSAGEWLFAKKQYSNLKIGVTLLVFLIAFVLL